MGGCLRVAIIIPAKNEEKSIALVVRGLYSNFSLFEYFDGVEILVVNDGKFG